jgi:hypothetical protein
MDIAVLQEWICWERREKILSTVFERLREPFIGSKGQGLDEMNEMNELNGTIALISWFD